jgi:hypothetical protein
VIPADDTTTDAIIAALMRRHVARMVVTVLDLEMTTDEAVAAGFGDMPIVSELDDEDE